MGNNKIQKNMKTIPWSEFKQEMLKDKKFAAEYEKLGPEFELEVTRIKERLKRKKKKGLLRR
jgi:hypothetical protein